MSTPPFTLKVLEHCKVTPQLNTISTISSLPLTFLDIPWLLFSPSQPLFFYDFPHSISYFTTTIVPKLKESLSLTLQHYFPFAGTFVPSLDVTEPCLKFTLNNSVSFIVAESNSEFKHLCSNHSRDVNEFHPLVPNLQQINSFEVKEFPLLAIQITSFPNSGFSIGLAFHHVVADGRTIHNFIKTWSYCSSSISEASSSLKSLPFYDRRVIIDPKGLREVFLKDWRKRRLVLNEKVRKEVKVDLANMTRATFIMSASQMEKIKNFIIESCKEKKKSQPLHLSSYVLTSAFFWVCYLKTQQEFVNENVIHEDVTHFGFIAGGITRLDFEVPKNYFGNCVGFGKVSLRRNDLLGEDGVVIAAKEIGSTIKKLDASILGEGEKWILDWEMLHGSEEHVHITWSPKLKLYELNFGWGKPKKIEEISIDFTRGVSFLESRDFEGGIEIGLALTESKMDVFAFLFNKGLEALP
ncbi:anthocyanin 5-aromatic acyltransferase-like [Trifolium pratense]|uniref:anthocyanin 5-aromatic acyltransferase-like n=1 Tax=Trifolium pratense TaxID=57577 RepID=UPI001E6901E2|nr:anthocyanin 5-aromatic acyltransferase-like [Trifolium pratense]